MTAEPVTRTAHLDGRFGWPFIWTLRRAGVSWHGVAISAILLVAGSLRLLWIDQQGYANSYYAAAVMSMLSD
jgi:hypothetical protein